MALSTFAFDPATGWNDSTVFPTYMSSEQEVRAKFQALHDQTRDEINTIIAEVNSKAPSRDATLIAPILSGNARATNPDPGTNSTRIATTHYVQGELASYAPIASPAFTGSPTAQTPSYDDNSTKLATTAYVKYWDGLLLTQLSAALSENVSFSLGSAVSGHANVSGYVTKIGRMVFVNIALTIQTGFAVGISDPILVIDAPPISNGSGCFGVATPGTVFAYPGFSDHIYVQFSKNSDKCNVGLRDPISAGHPGTYYISGFYVTG